MNAKQLDLALHLSLAPTQLVLTIALLAHLDTLEMVMEPMDVLTSTNASTHLLHAILE